LTGLKKCKVLLNGSEKIKNLTATSNVCNAIFRLVSLIDVPIKTISLTNGNIIRPIAKLPDIQKAAELVEIKVPTEALYRSTPVYRVYSTLL